MPITEYLERNSDLYGDDVALVESYVKHTVLPILLPLHVLTEKCKQFSRCNEHPKIAYIFSYSFRFF